MMMSSDVSMSMVSYREHHKNIAQTLTSVKVLNSEISISKTEQSNTTDSSPNLAMNATLLSITIDYIGINAENKNEDISVVSSLSKISTSNSNEKDAMEMALPISSPKDGNDKSSLKCIDSPHLMTV
jgi:hypothetical protein